jgi:putative membrane protein
MKSYWKNKTLLATAIACVAGGTMIAQSQSSGAASGKTTTGAAASATAATGSELSAADTKFANNAAIGGLMEVELGKVAVKNASSDKVRQFGQKMIDDHTKANDELKSVAAKEKITLPTDLDAKHKGMVDKLSAMTGTAFDRAYMKDMVKDHKQDVAEFQKEANDGTDPGLKSFAGMTLPTLQQHLMLAQEDESSLSSTSKK